MGKSFVYLNLNDFMHIMILIVKEDGAGIS